MIRKHKALLLSSAVYHGSYARFLWAPAPKHWPEPVIEKDE